MAAYAEMCFFRTPKTSKTASVLNYIETKLKKNTI